MFGGAEHLGGGQAAFEEWDPGGYQRGAGFRDDAGLTQNWAPTSTARRAKAAEVIVPAPTQTSGLRSRRSAMTFPTVDRGGDLDAVQAGGEQAVDESEGGAAVLTRMTGMSRVVAGIVVLLPFLSHPVCLPVLAQLWRPRHTGKIAHARELAKLIAARYPDRTVHVVGDAAYVGEPLRDVDGGGVAGAVGAAGPRTVADHPVSGA